MFLRLLHFFNYFNKAPVFGFAEGTGFGNAHGIADAAFVFLVVRHESAGFVYELTVLRVLYLAHHGNHDAFVHLVAFHNTDFFFSEISFHGCCYFLVAMVRLFNSVIIFAMFLRLSRMRDGFSTGEIAWLINVLLSDAFSSRILSFRSWSDKPVISVFAILFVACQAFLSK
jgi:hypothetical protein